MLKRILLPAIVLIGLILLTIVYFQIHHGDDTTKPKVIDRSSPLNDLPTLSQTTNKQQSKFIIASSRIPKSVADVWQSVTVKAGDTLQKVFKKMAINSQDLWQLLKQKDHRFTQLHTGQQLSFRIDKDHDLLAMKYPLDGAHDLLIQKQANVFTTQEITKPLAHRVAFKMFSIHGSLAQSAKKAGLPNKIYQQLFTAFRGTVNFTRDIKSGDHVAVLYNNSYLHNKKYQTGNLLIGELTVRGKPYHAIRYTYPKNHTGYYTTSGKQLAHLFMTYPLQFKRISSFFSYHRLDPITHHVRPHLGVDFAAKTGTPIKSIGNGKVIFAGKKGGYGNAVIVKYGKHYRALYAHMEKFASGLHVNESVNRNQIIGYVGQSGWATGPHLHFGFFVDGVAKNWLAFKQPPGEPIPASYTTKFKNTANHLLAQLQLKEQPLFAVNNTSK